MIEEISEMLVLIYPFLEPFVMLIVIPLPCLFLLGMFAFVGNMMVVRPMERTVSMPMPMPIQKEPEIKKSGRLAVLYWNFRFWLRDFVNKHFPEDKVQ